MSDFKAELHKKIDFRSGSAPDPAGGAYSAPPDSLYVRIYRGLFLSGGMGKGAWRERRGEGICGCNVKLVAARLVRRGGAMCGQQVLAQVASLMKRSAAVLALVARRRPGRVEAGDVRVERVATAHAPSARRARDREAAGRRVGVAHVLAQRRASVEPARAQPARLARRRVYQQVLVEVADRRQRPPTHRTHAAPSLRAATGRQWGVTGGGFRYTGGLI